MVGISVFSLFFWLLVGHALSDYPLQGSFLSAAKRVNGVANFPWWIALSAHALIHGGSVALVTGSVTLGLLETLCHFVIDKLKCENMFGVAIDQALHVVCKIVWVIIWASGRIQ